jgi:hypothetical protein
MNLNARMLRILVCVAFAGLVVSQGFSMMTDSKNSVVTQSFGFASTGLGFLILIYGFSPEKAKQIISEISRIIRKLLTGSSD